jgi:hypothetical protein
MFGLSTSEITNIASLFISAFSLLFGFIQNKSKRDLKRLFANDAIEIHENVFRGLGAIQAAKNNLSNTNELMREMGRTEGYLQALLTGTAKIFCNLRKTSIDEIMEMIRNGQLIEGYKDTYLQYSKNTRRGYISQALLWVKKLW